MREQRRIHLSTIMEEIKPMFHKIYFITQLLSELLA